MNPKHGATLTPSRRSRPVMPMTPGRALDGASEGEPLKDDGVLRKSGPQVTLGRVGKARYAQCRRLTSKLGLVGYCQANKSAPACVNFTNVPSRAAQASRW